MKKKTFSSLACLFLCAGLSGADAPNDPALLFEATFDGYSVTADHAKGNPKSTTFPNPSLQLRMWNGIKNTGNALALEKTEQCAYSGKDNFDPRQGTVSLWVAPLNWKPSSKHMQFFFTAYQPGFTMYVYKYVWANYLFFYIKYDNAPGTKNTSVASTKIEDEDWAVNKWHKLDAVWDRSGMKIYVDGILPKPSAKPNSAPTHPHWKFDTPVDFPAPSPDASIALGAISKGEDQGHRTAYDNLRIYNRPLSAKEINSEYTKYYASQFGSKKEQLAASVPKSARPVKVDGVIDPAEWSDAACIPLHTPTTFHRNKNLKINGKVYLKHDGRNLYAAFFSDAPPALAKHAARDAALWEDDSFEFHLNSRKRDEKYQFIINPNGAVFDQKNGLVKWNSNLKTNVRKGKDFWSAELELPLADLGGITAADDWTANFYITNFANGMGSFCWSLPGAGGYDSPGTFGKLMFRQDPAAVQITEFGDLANGKMSLKANALPAGGKNRIKAFYELENGTRVDFSGDLAKEAWSASLPVGRQRLVVTAADASGNNLYLYESFFYVNYPLELKYDCRPQEKQIAVSLDLNNAGTELLKKLASQELKGKVRLRSEQNRSVLSEQSFATKKSIFTVSLPIPAKITEGSYRIEAEVEDGTRKIENHVPFHVPDMTPFTAKTAVDHSVPEPWTPVVKVNSDTFRVLDREYRFNGGPFPEQIISRGSRLLTAPPALTIDGKKVTWSDYRIVREYPDYVELAGQGKNEQFRFTWNGKLWFDGMYLVDWDMTPIKTPERVKSMTLACRIPAEFGTYVFKQAYNQPLETWKNNRIEKEFNPLKHVHNNLLWMSGTEKGFAWHPKSNANWANNPGEKNLILTRNEKEIEFTANIISRPVEVKSRLWYTMVFQGTPSRSPIKDWRDYNYGGYQVPTMQNIQFGGGGDHTFADYKTPGRWTTPSSHKPRWKDRYVEEVKTQIEKDKRPNAWKTKSHLPYRLINYVMPSHIATNEPEYDFFFNEWVTLPTCIWGFKEDGMDQTLFAACGQTGITDVQMYNLENLFRINPRLGGIYNDCAHSKVCENTRHGCGGIDAFGQKYRTSTMLGQRDFMLREYKLIRKYGKTLINHVPSADMVPFVHNFSDHIWPGEEFYSSFGQNPDYFYCEGFPKEAYQSAMNSTIRGVSIILLPQPGRASSSLLHLKARNKDFLKNPEWAIRTMTPALLHDFGVSPAYIEEKTVDRWWILKDQLKLADAVFHGYWVSGQVKSASPDVYASWYELPANSPYRYLIVAGNLGRKEQKLALTHKFPKNLKFYELWESKGTPMSAEDLKKTTIKGNHFALIGVK